MDGQASCKIVRCARRTKRVDVLRGAQTIRILPEFQSPPTLKQRQDVSLAEIVRYILTRIVNPYSAHTLCDLSQILSIFCRTLFLYASRLGTSGPRNFMSLRWVHTRTRARELSATAASPHYITTCVYPHTRVGGVRTSPQPLHRPFFPLSQLSETFSAEQWRGPLVYVCRTVSAPLPLRLRESAAARPALSPPRLARPAAAAANSGAQQTQPTGTASPQTRTWSRSLPTMERWHLSLPRYFASGSGRRRPR